MPLWSIFIAVALLIPISQARADVPVRNLIHETLTQTLVQKDFSLDAIALGVAKSMIQTMTTQIVNWIKQGDSRGPLVIENFLEHFTREMDNAVGLFLEQYFGRNSALLGALCEPLRLSLPPLLNVHRSSSFTQQARCKLSDIVRNVENFQVNVYFDDFSQGGWDAWFAMLEPEHNNLGGYLIGVTELERQRAGAFLGSQTEVQTTGGGLLSWQECADVPVTVRDDDGNSIPSPDGRTYKGRCKTQTPGGIIDAQLKNTEISWLKQLEVADEIDEIINAFATQMLQELLSPLGGFSGRNEGSINNSSPPPPPPPPVPGPVILNPPIIAGSWSDAFNGGATATIQQTAGSLQFSSNGSISGGYFTTQNTVYASSWNIFGTVDATLTRIDWANGNVWTKQ